MSETGEILNGRFKFRIWDGQMWVQDFYSSHSGCLSFNSIFDQKGFTFQQYTGLKDKNGKDIFEGDIINYTPFNQSDYKNIHATVPDFGKFHWFQDLQDMLSEENKCDIEVIGNVFETPNLLR
jgi:uncharacterized phage protein (TIGR01671 family)